MRTAARGKRVVRAGVILGIAGAAACATLGGLIEPPTFTEAQGRSAQLRLLGPSAERPAGGAAIRLWARIRNPNAFGLNITTVRGTLALEGTDAADVNLPIGLPLDANQDTIIPIDVGLSFADLPGLADVAVRAVTGGTLGYELDGTFGVDAGPFGEASFGPTRLLTGEMRVLR